MRLLVLADLLDKSLKQAHFRKLEKRRSFRTTTISWLLYMEVLVATSDCELLTYKAPKKQEDHCPDG